MSFTFGNNSSFHRISWVSPRIHQNFWQQMHKYFHSICKYFYIKSIELLAACLRKIFISKLFVCTTFYQQVVLWITFLVILYMSNDLRVCWKVPNLDSSKTHSHTLKSCIRCTYTCDELDNVIKLEKKKMGGAYVYTDKWTATVIRWNVEYILCIRLHFVLWLT